MSSLHNMWKSGNIYWNLGQNLLMINPNRNVQQYNDNNIFSFITNISNHLTQTQQNQSIINLGITGSGKTV